jgi:methyl-accepting chemotaxis protein
MRAISFKLKIYIGFALLLAFMGVVAFIGYNALSGSSEGFEEYREVARKTNLLSRVQANMLMVRMNAKDYIISGDETRYEQLEEYLEKTSGFLAEASENVGDQETAEVMAEVRADLTAYDKAFDEVADGMAERERLFSEVLAVEGPVMEEKLSGIMSSASKDNDVDTAFSGGVAMRNLLLARLYTALFISSGDEAHAERVKSEFSELDGELSILDRELQDAERRALLSDVIESKERYVAAFSEYAAATYSRDRIIAERLNVLGPEIADYVGDIKLGYMAVQDDLGPRLQSENAKAVTGMLTAAGIALALAVADFHRRRRDPLPEQGRGLLQGHRRRRLRQRAGHQGSWRHRRSGPKHAIHPRDPQGGHGRVQPPGFQNRNRASHRARRSGRLQGTVRRADLGREQALRRHGRLPGQDRDPDHGHR